jgi:hypothetical protein
MFLSHTLLAALALCWSSPAVAPSFVRATTQAPLASARHFPVPEEGLSIPAPREGGATLLNLLDDFSRVTGQNLHASDETRTRLRETPIGLMRGVEVPATEVYSFVESLLRESDFVLLDKRQAAPRLLAIKWLLSQRRQGVRQGCVTVPVANIEAYKRHPALMIQTVVEVPNIDAQQLSNVLRLMVTDQYTQQVVAMDGTAILMGTGRQVAQWAEMLRSLNELSPVQQRSKGPQRKGESDAKQGTGGG